MDDGMSLKIGEPAPGFSLEDLEGQAHTVEEGRGRIVLLNFWSAECPHSERVDRALLPRLAAWGDRVVLFPIAANANEPVDLLRQAAAARGLSGLLLDPQHEVADRYVAVATPHFFLVDAGGNLRYQGAFDDVTFRQRQPTRSYLVEAVEAVLAGRDPDPLETPAFGCTIVRYSPQAGEE